ncbi:hypothetical protein BTJ48_05794 [Bacillus mycoides]|nr:hypothetical protein B4117_0508 [Bacillus mycoides]OSY12785.1 hypothetical protein BTJ48_05794 [Bacillus mycoides]
MGVLLPKNSGIKPKFAFNILNHNNKILTYFHLVFGNIL